MGFDQYHEPAGELPAATRTFARLCGSITEATWEEIDEEARSRLKPALAARKLVDFSGPRGWEHSATSLGRTKPVDPPGVDGVIAQQRRVLEVVELRAPFSLSRAELRDA